MTFDIRMLNPWCVVYLHRLCLSTLVLLGISMGLPAYLGCRNDAFRGILAELFYPRRQNNDNVFIVPIWNLTVASRV